MSRAKTPVYNVPFKRRGKNITDYKKRLKLVKSRKVRMVVRKSNKDVKIQLVDYHPEGDKTILSVDKIQLSKYGWNSRKNIYTAYLGGLLIGKLAVSKKISSVVPDFGHQKASKGSILFASIKGINDAGININFDNSMVPNDKLENVAEKYKSKFEEVKKKILSGVVAK